MSLRTLVALVALALTCVLLALSPSVAARDLPADSLYRFDAALTDQDGTALRFAGGQGEPRLVSMFYANCPFMCPLLIDTIRRSERELTAAERTRLKVLLVSFDARNDTPAALRALADQRQLDTPRWTLARAEAADVRSIAALLDIPFRELQDGHFSHAGVMVLLDGAGRAVARSDRMGKLDADFIAALRQVLGAPTGTQ